MNALLCLYLLPSSPLRSSLLDSEDLANSSCKFDISDIVNFNVYEFKFTGDPPARICLFLSKLVSHSPSVFRCSALEQAQVHAPLFPLKLMGPNLVRVWAVPLFS